MKSWRALSHKNLWVENSKVIAGFLLSVAIISCTASGGISSEPSSDANVDNNAPTVSSISAPSPANGNSSSSFVFTVTFSKNVTVVTTAANVTLGGAATAGCGKSIAQGAANTATITVTGCTGNGTLNVASLTAGTAADAAGNSAATYSTASSDATVDNTAPTVSSISAPSPSAGKSSTSFAFTVTYSENVTVVTTAGNVTLGGTATAGCGKTIAQGAANTATITVTGCTGNGTLNVASLAAGTAADAAGNSAALYSTASSNATVDNTVPTVTIAAPSKTNALTSHNVTYAVSITNSSTINFTAANVTLNLTGTASCSKSVSGSAGAYVVLVNGCTGAGTVAISIAAGVGTNAFGDSSAAVGPSTAFNLLTDNGIFAYITATAPVISSTVLSTVANNSLEMADLNGDGKMDVILAVKAGGAKVLINNGSGRFATGYAFGGSGASPVVTDTRGVITGDFNEDGHTDLILVNYAGGRSRVYLNTISGSDWGTVWTAGQELPSCTTSLTTVTPAMKGIAGNFNSGDSHLDVAIANETTNNTCYYKGVGDGTFTYFTGTGVLADYQVETNKRDAQDIQMGDLDGDGDMDFIIASREAKTDVVCKNNGSAVFTCSDLQLGGVAEVLCDEAIVLGDLNHDNRLDIVFGNRSSATTGCVNNATDHGGASRFSLQNSDGTFAAAQLITNTGDGDQTYDLRLADINGDGYLDLVRGNRNAKDSVHRWDSAGSTFTTFSGGANDYYGSWASGSTGTYGIEVADFDGDGLKDIIVATNDATNAASYYFGYRSAVHTSWLANDGNNNANASAKFSTTATSVLGSVVAAGPTLTAGSNLDNLSGVAYDPVRNKYYFIRNNSLYIHETDTSFATLRDISLTGFTSGSGFDGDLEGIVYLGQSGGNSMFAITDEIGDIFIGTIPATGTTMSKASLTALYYDTANVFNTASLYNSGWTSAQKNLGIEGIAYDAFTRTFWAVREGSSSFNRSVFSFQIDSGFTTISNIKSFVWNTPSDLSDIVFNPATETLLLLSHESGKIYELTRGGNMIGQHALTSGATPQYEGITLGPSNRLIVNSENSNSGTVGVGSRAYYDYIP